VAQPCVPSNQVIATSIPGPINSDGGSITISAFGSAGNGGVAIGCGATTVDNAGNVSGVTVQNVGSVGDSIGALTNSGTISGDGIYNEGTITQLSNSGTISDGIFNRGIISQLSNSGTIIGISNVGTISQLSNSGTVSGISNVGTIGQLSNSGTVSGACYYPFGSYALISGSPFCSPDSGPSCYTQAQGRVSAIGPITNSGVIDGNIEIQHQDVTIIGGSGSVFGVLTGGTMTIPDGNLFFAGGNQLLAQNIAVSSGQGTVTNSGNLMLASPQSITGNYVQGSAGSLIIGIGATTAGRLDVSGTATLRDATVAPRLLGTIGSYVLPLGQRFQVISAQGGVQGSVGSLIQPASLGDPGVRFDLPVDPPGSLSVVLTPSNYGNLAALGIAASAAASSVGSGLDAARPAAGAAMTPGQVSLYAPLYALGADQIAPTLQQMAPAIYADAPTVNRSTFQMVSTVINRELEARRGAPAATRSSTATGPQDTTIWLDGTGRPVPQPEHQR
jgi:hypothetical protein